MLDATDVPPLNTEVKARLADAHAFGSLDLRAQWRRAGAFEHKEAPMNSNSPAHHGLIALEVAEDAAVEVIALMRGLPAAMRIYQDQAVRASASAVLNIAEGAGRRGRDRRRFWQVAHASTKEVMSAVRVAVRSRAVDQRAGERVLALLDRLGALTYGLWRGAG